MLALAVGAFFGGVVAAASIGAVFPLDEDAFNTVAWRACGILFALGFWVRFFPERHRFWTEPLAAWARAAWDPVWYRVRVAFWFALWVAATALATYRALKAATVVLAGVIVVTAERLGASPELAWSMALLVTLPLAGYLLFLGFHRFAARDWHRPTPPPTARARRKGPPSR